MEIVINRRPGQRWEDLIASAIAQFSEKFPETVLIKNASIKLKLEYPGVLVDSAENKILKLMLDDNGVLVNVPRDLIPLGGAPKYLNYYGSKLRVEKLDMLNASEWQQRVMAENRRSKEQWLESKLQREKYEEEKRRIAAEKERQKEERRQAKKRQHEHLMATDESYRSQVEQKKLAAQEKAKATRLQKEATKNSHLS